MFTTETAISPKSTGRIIFWVTGKTGSPEYNYGCHHDVHRGADPCMTRRMFAWRTILFLSGNTKLPRSVQPEKIS